MYSKNAILLCPWMLSSIFRNLCIIRLFDWLRWCQHCSSVWWFLSNLLCILSFKISFLLSFFLRQLLRLGFHFCFYFFFFFFSFFFRVLHLLSKVSDIFFLFHIRKSYLSYLVTLVIIQLINSRFSFLVYVFIFVLIVLFLSFWFKVHNKLGYIHMAHILSKMFIQSNQHKNTLVEIFWF